jgi:multicomponent Na+:H+ antiporter subunit D
MHVAMHAFGKVTLFFCAGAIYVTAHKTRVSELDGIGRKMPVTMVAFFLASLSLIGMPPFGGMWSKWHLALGAAQSGHEAFVAVLMLSSVLSIAYLMPPVVRAFFCEPEPEHHVPVEPHHDAYLEDETELDGDALSKPPAALAPPPPRPPRWTDAPALCLIPLCVTALGGFALFFFAEPLYQLLLPIVGGAR